MTHKEVYFGTWFCRLDVEDHGAGVCLASDEGCMLLQFMMESGKPGVTSAREEGTKGTWHFITTSS